MSSKDGNKPKAVSTGYQPKDVVHKRDRYTCVNCLERFNDISHLDVDHIVPRGSGGSNAIRNQATECRRCHKAKHGERDHAPTVRFVSTRDMADNDFEWFRHLWKRQFPALTEIALNHPVEPKINISENNSYKAWHIPIGDLRRLDRVLNNTENLSYTPLELHRYM